MSNIFLTVVPDSNRNLLEKTLSRVPLLVALAGTEAVTFSDDKTKSRRVGLSKWGTRPTGEDVVGLRTPKRAKTVAFLFWQTQRCQAAPAPRYAIRRCEYRTFRVNLALALFHFLIGSGCPGDIAIYGMMKLTCGSRIALKLALNWRTSLKMLRRPR